MPFSSVDTENGTPVCLHYEDHGEGRPVVLMHGWPTSARSWERQIGPLVDRGYRVITYDRRGFGRSAQPWDGYDYQTLARDLQLLIEHLGLVDVTLVGACMAGGEVVRHLAIYGPGRVGKAVLAGAAVPYPYRSYDNPEGWLEDADIARLTAGLSADRLDFLDRFTTEMFRAGERTDLVSAATLAYYRGIAAQASAKATLDCVTAFARTDLRNDLAAVTVPTLIIHGDSDAVFPYEASGARAHRAITGSEAVVIEGGPHWVNVTHPRQFNRALLDFLAA
jgi:pimeloyl-ACP methyl ester carboxylesterase